MKPSKFLNKVLNFEEVDRTAVIPLIFAHAAIISNVPICDYLRDGEILAECQIKAFQKYEYDAADDYEHNLNELRTCPDGFDRFLRNYEYLREVHYINLVGASAPNLLARECR